MTRGAGFAPKILRLRGASRSLIARRRKTKLKHTQNILVLQILAAFVESSCYFGSACEVLAAITLYTHPLEVLSQSLLFVVSPPPTTLEF